MNARFIMEAASTDALTPGAPTTANASPALAFTWTHAPAFVSKSINFVAAIALWKLVTTYWKRMADSQNNVVSGGKYQSNHWHCLKTQNRRNMSKQAKLHQLQYDNRIICGLFPHLIQLGLNRKPCSGSLKYNLTPQHSHKQWNTVLEGFGFWMGVKLYPGIVSC